MLLQSRNIKMVGELVLKKFDDKMRLIEQVEVPNLVVNVGKQYIASRMAFNSADLMSHMAIGNNNTTPQLGNTSLISELARVAFDSVNINNTTVSFTATFGPTVGTGNLVEAGIFNASSEGIMLCRTTFPTVSKSPTQTISITWNVSVG